MRSTSRRIARSAVGTLVLLCVSAAAGRAQSALQPVMHIASLASGSIQGTVQDETGAAVAGATVSALGGTTAFAGTDRSGRFDFRALTPGPYLVRAHLTGFVAPRGQLVDVRPSARVTSAIALRRVGSGTGVIAAGFGPPVPTGTSGDAAPPDSANAPSSATSGTSDDHGEVAWRLRHARRSILKDVVIPDEIVADDAPRSGGAFVPQNMLSLFGSPAHAATDFFAGTPFSGQLNLLTTGSFDTPEQLFTSNNFARSVAYASVSAPVGAHADWTARAALTQGDIASWIVAGEYTTRAPATHRYDLGVSYSTQRYDGGNLAALRGVTDGSRNAGSLYAFDTWALTPKVTVSYGSRYDRYDYLEDRSLISPRVALTLQPADHFRITTMLSRREVAPGAEEFMPQFESGVWLPPQRTFSSLLNGQSMQAERTSHMEVELEHDIAAATVSLRAFRQHVSDQFVTLFGVDTPTAPESHVGHYFVHDSGDVDAQGLSAGIRASLADRIHGTVQYSVMRSDWSPSRDVAYLLLFAPSAVREHAEHIHDIATSIETEVPETSTRVVVLYRVSNGFAHASAGAAVADRPQLDSRFDVQVHQSLPFMDFSSAKWEMLVAVRNFFRETAADQSAYDELLVVRPPKRVVGGITLKF